MGSVEEKFIPSLFVLLSLKQNLLFVISQELAIWSFASTDPKIHSTTPASFKQTFDNCSSRSHQILRARPQNQETPLVAHSRIRGDSDDAISPMNRKSPSRTEAAKRIEKALTDKMEPEAKFSRAARVTTLGRRSDISFKSVNEGL